MKKYIWAFDQGTSSSRAILFDFQGKVVASEQKEFSQYYPEPGFVEQEPNEIWDSQITVAKRLLEKTGIKPTEIAALGITNQRETTVIWDKNTGKPIHKAIVWQDRRTAERCNELKHSEIANYIQQKTGLIVDAYFSATKIEWILRNVENARKKAQNGELLFGTIDSWLIWKLTNGKSHITDFSNASRTMLFDIDKLEWDENLLQLFEIPKSILPNVQESSKVHCYTDKSIFGEEILIGGIAGDQQAALFGQTCFETGTAKNTYGTGCFMLMHTGNQHFVSKSGLLTTIACGIDKKIEYALEGSVFIAGAAIKWLRDGLKIIRSASETEKIATEIPSSEGVYVVPAFAGLGAPHWDMYARGTIMGLTQGITHQHIVRATLESIAYQTKDVLDAMFLDSGIKLKMLNVDGGACVNNFLMQFQADILNTNVMRPSIIETTALGVAYLAGIAANIWNKQEIIEKHQIEKTFSPKMSEIERNNLYAKWHKTVERVKLWEKI